MYFKKLEIVGFKSFAEKVTLKFEPGLTAVVGPNGCGKSNIFDAIRWALGEQSIKSLRGSRMEDVIFNGTETIPALGFAEVSITFSNEAKILPIDYEEVTITRRLYRSGESEYLINNNPVRLKDINELLMGTGIGAESYSLVEQGKIDLVLSSKPEDRRLVFDEATGVSKYKAKKQEATRKLEDTENNLLRVNDIIQEVKRQISSIERQANKARRYKEIFDKLKELEISLARHEIKDLGQQYDQLKNTDAEYRDRIAKEEEGLHGLTAQREKIQKEIEGLNHECLRLNNDLIYNQNQAEQKFQVIKINEERVLDLNRRVEAIEQNKQNLAKRINQQEEELSRIRAELAKNEKDIKEKSALLSQKESLLEETEEGIREAKDAIRLANEKNFAIAANTTKLNNELIDISSSLNGLAARKQRLRTEVLKTTEEKQAQQNELNAAQSEVESLRRSFQSKKENIAALKTAFSSLEKTIEDLKKQMQAVSDRLISLQSQKEFLQQLKLKYEDMPTAKDAELVIHDIEKIAESDISGIIAKAKAVRYDAQKKQYLISCEAKLFSLDIKHLEETIAQTKKQIEEKTAVKDKHEAQAQRQKEELGTLEAALQKDHIVLIDKEAVLKSSQANVQRICDELSLHELDLDEVTENIAQRENRKTLATKELAELKEVHDDQENIIRAAQAKIQDKTELREKLLLETTELKTQLDAIRIKGRDTADTVSLLASTQQDDNKSLESLEFEKKECNQKASELNQESSAFTVAIEQLKEKRIQTQKNEIAKKEELAAQSSLLHQLNEEEQKLITRNANLRDHLHQQELKMQERAFKLNQIKERMLQVYQCTLEEMTDFLAPAAIDLEATRQEIDHLRTKVDTFGSVNLVAIEELDELKKRHDFLEHQQNDLNTAKQSLLEAIQKINRTTRKMFLDTFHAVAVEFKNYFRLLFGGGDAEVFLIDEANVLESGIEIVCRPPGKKLQNILLLSGGERSLSAIALIFAIFKTKPAPFCVLDEIDAALDESNVDRFSRILKDFENTSQFIVITHNKKTIVHAHVMYGITMERSGISKIVSVKLSETDALQPRKEPAAKKDKKTTLSPAESY